MLAALRDLYESATEPPSLQDGCVRQFMFVLDSVVKNCSVSRRQVIGCQESVVLFEGFTTRPANSTIINVRI